MTGLSRLNPALTKIAARAEKRDAAVLRDTFVDSGVADQLDTVDHEVLYSRRGTGETHAVSRGFYRSTPRTAQKATLMSMFLHRPFTRFTGRSSTLS